MAFQVAVHLDFVPNDDIRSYAEFLDKYGEMRPPQSMHSTVDFSGKYDPRDHTFFAVARLADAKEIERCARETGLVKEVYIDEL